MGLLKVWCNWRENNRHNGGSLSLIQEAAGLVLLGKITNLGGKKQSVNLTLQEEVPRREFLNFIIGDQWTRQSASGWWHEASPHLR